MITCNFIQISDKLYQCSQCNNIITVMDDIEGPPVFPCASPIRDQTNKQGPSMIKKLTNFAVAMANHVREGMPTCTEQEISDRYDICLGCEFFKDQTCTKCGCPLIRDKIFVSKLAWADQECPVGKWSKKTTRQYCLC